MKEKNKIKSSFSFNGKKRKVEDVEINGVDFPLIVDSKTFFETAAKVIEKEKDLNAIDSADSEALKKFRLIFEEVFLSFFEELNEEQKATVDEMGAIELAQASTQLIEYLKPKVA